MGTARHLRASLAEVMAQDHILAARARGLPERTVRYYLSKVLEAPAGTPGRKSYYDQLTVDQLVLAQQILTQDYDPEKGEVKPTLREFRDWLDGLDEDALALVWRTLAAWVTVIAAGSLVAALA